MLFAEVRLLDAPYTIDKSYCYEVPLQLEAHIRPGSVVVVPFGGSNRTQNAVVERLSDRASVSIDRLKPVLGIPGKYMYVKPELLDLCHFMSSRLFCSVGDAIKCVLPAGLGVRRTTFYSAVPKEERPPVGESLNVGAKKILDRLEKTGRMSVSELRSAFGTNGPAGGRALCSLGLCRSEEDYECTVNTKKEKYIALTDDSRLIEQLADGTLSVTAKQKKLCEALLCSETALPLTEVLTETGVRSGVAKELADKGIVRLFEICLDRSEGVLRAFDRASYGDFMLSDEQNEALRELLSLYRAPEPKAALLWGVTGSGKTNVILKLIDRVIADGKTVIVLVPEIALTAQTVGRFAARYEKSGIALIHSALSAGERTDAWKRINDGEARIVIGTRSAVFAPLENIGLIVMDEEHETSFKSDRSPKYHARDIAKFRCVYHKALLVMASATPCVESFYKAKQGTYAFVKLTSRYGGNALPQVEFYDMRTEPYYELPDDAFRPNADAPNDASAPFIAAETSDSTEASAASVLPPPSYVTEADREMPTVLGSRLKEALTDCLSRGEQAILFVNRRGYRAFALCRSCGHVFTCPNCSVSLSHHKNRRTGVNRMVCHYCGYSEQTPTVCPTCKKERISYMGSGTQLVEDALLRQFPKARVLRMDADTTAVKFGHEKILSDFRAGEADILVGTQMVAKGHDFPRVSLVGVVMADTSLFVNDYRAGEKTFSLLTQVLGRAGRAEGTNGHAVVQTYVPDNEVLKLASMQDYERFYESEIRFRKASVFPPYCDIITLNFSAPVEMDVINATRIFGEDMDKLARSEFTDVKFILFGPFRHEPYRLAGRFRMRFIIKCRAGSRIREMLSVLLKKYIPAFKTVSLSADINPNDL